MTVAEQIAALNLQLASSQEHVATLSKAIDGVRQEASDAVGDLRKGLATEQALTTELRAHIQNFSQQQQQQQQQPRVPFGEREMSLVNTKEFHGGKFLGAKNESFKIWSRKVRIFCNAQKGGFRKVLEDIENNEDQEISTRVINEMTWEHAVLADSKHSDFLATYCGDDALGIVESVPERGFEAWRKLKVCYKPSGGAP